VTLGSASGSIVAGVNVPYSAEFRDRQANMPLLESLAALVPEGGEGGLLIRDDEHTGELEALLEFNSFRHDLPKAASREDAWPALLLAAGCLFFADVFVRRVAVRFEWLAMLWRIALARWLGRKVPAERSEYLQRLRGRKREVAHELEQRKAAARFEPAPEALDEAEELAPLAAAAAPPAAARPDSRLAPEQRAEEETYTERLLKAKKKVWDDRKG
jgi:hypothetical protein